MIFEKTVLVHWNRVGLGKVEKGKEMKAGRKFYRHTRIKQKEKQGQAQAFVDTQRSVLA